MSVRVARFRSLAVRSRLIGVFSSTFVIFSVYQLTIVLLPFYASRIGYREVAAGALTATFMTGAVIGPLFGPRLFARPGIRATVVWSLILHVGSTLLLGQLDTLWQLLVVNGLRGTTFGILAAALPVVVVTNTSPGERGGALGVWGVVCTVPVVFAPTLAVALVEKTTLEVAMSLAAGVMLLSLAPLARQRWRAAWPGAGELTGDKPLSASPRWRPALAPSLLFLGATVTYGAVVSFMPLFLTGNRPAVATSIAFLLAMGLTLPMGRVLGGTRNAGGLTQSVFPLGVLLTALGLGVVLISTAGPASAIAGAAYGTGFGIVTTGSQLALLTRIGADRPDLGSVLFSAIFNAGIGAGGLVAGMIGELASLRAAFAACALASLLTMPVALAIARKGWAQ